MLTEVGKLLRKVRIENNELLYDMAKRIGMTSSQLSGVENNVDKRLTVDQTEKAISEYSLKHTDAELLRNYSIKS